MYKDINLITCNFPIESEEVATKIKESKLELELKGSQGFLILNFGNKDNSVFLQDIVGESSQKFHNGKSRMVIQNPTLPEVQMMEKIRNYFDKIGVKVQYEVHRQKEIIIPDVPKYKGLSLSQELKY